MGKYVFDAEAHYRAERRALAIEVAALKRKLSAAHKLIADQRYLIEHGKPRARSRSRSSLASLSEATPSSAPACLSPARSGLAGLSAPSSAPARLSANQKAQT